ncbi:MAG: hypothetical protein HQL31_13485, partial [Planctomycetes bacterium]|nr:hypothetical protein [Planctomycetota bacterium]
MHNLLEKVRRMRELGLQGVLGTWCFGNQPSLNQSAFTRFMRSPRLRSPTAELRSLAEEYLPGADTREVVGAWKDFATAMRNFPYSMAFLYMGPVAYASALPLRPGPAGKRDLGRSWCN